jgi:D-alanyl-D-alanine carboxypeptidase/D-alanyl-D-alanine-endopeptidase (penicillin-binding protein 4)
MVNFEELNIQYSMSKYPFSMKKAICIFCFSLFIFDFFGQSVSQKLQKAFTKFEADSQMKYGIASLYVVDAQTGQVVFDKNSRIGLAPASTQKIITSVTAFELLGKEYRYKTEMGITNKLENGLTGKNLNIIGNGDPTFGSWRWERTNKQNVLKDFLNVLKSNNLYFISDSYNFGVTHFEKQSIPDGWIWQDIGNYYGSSAAAINWGENQFDILLSSGNKVGDSVKVLKTIPKVSGYTVSSDLKSAAKGSGDNAYAYLPIGQNIINLYGTIPVNEKEFRISVSLPDPFNSFMENLVDSSFAEGRKEGSSGLRFGFNKQNFIAHINGADVKERDDFKLLYTHYSPTLDSIIYWFNKKSINLYGEALIKTFAYEKNGFGATDSGIVVLKNFWKEKGMDEDELSIVDGSGLSPINRVTTHAQVEILKYAKNKEWFPFFFNSLPEFNGMKIKSGTIRGVKAYCGYHKAKNGKEYIFSFIVNNYNGLPSGIVNKMYAVLNNLK